MSTSTPNPLFSGDRVQCVVSHLERIAGRYGTVRETFAPLGPNHVATIARVRFDRLEDERTGRELAPELTTDVGTVALELVPADVDARAGALVQESGATYPAAVDRARYERAHNILPAAR